MPKTYGSGNYKWKAMRDAKRGREIAESRKVQGVDSAIFEAKYPGICKLSGLKYNKGSRIAHFRGHGLVLESVFDRILGTEKSHAQLLADIDEAKRFIVEGVYSVEDEEIFGILVQIVTSQHMACVACVCRVQAEDGKVPEHKNEHDTSMYAPEACWGSKWSPRPALSLDDVPAEWVAAHREKLDALIARRAERAAKREGK